MLPKSIFFLLFLGTVFRYSISEKIVRNDSLIFSENLRDPNAFVLVNPKQLHRLEGTIRRFLSKVAEPVKGPIILRSTSKGNDVRQTIREMCESMRAKLMRFAQDCGMTVTVQRSLRTSTDLSEDWFSEMLLQGAYILRDLGNVIDETRTSIDRYFGVRNATSQRNRQLTRQADSFHFLGVVYDAADFGDRFSQCLSGMSNNRKYKSPSDLNRSLLDLMKRSPEDALKAFGSNVNRASVKAPPKNRAGYKSWHGLLCLSMMSDGNVRYNDCIRDLQHLDECLRALKRRSNSETRSVEVKSWTKAIQRLSNCKIRADKRGKLQVSCKTDRKIPRRMKQRIRYMFEKILGKRIARRSPLHRAADHLGDTLSRREWGRRFVDELSQYFMIYEDGLKKLYSFSKTNDERAMARHREVSKALREYKTGILLRTFGAFGKMHRSAMEFEKFLVEGIKVALNETWQGHVQVISSLMNWMTKLLEFYGGENISGGQSSSDASAPSDEEWDDVESMNSDEAFADDLRNRALSRSKTDMMKETDRSMSDLMKSMNRVARHRSANEKSMLSCLANNLLLITMFMETIGFVSALFCSGQPVKDDSNSLDIDDEWKRRRRWLRPLHYQDDFRSISQDYLLLEIRANGKGWITDEKDYFNNK